MKKILYKLRNLSRRKQVLTGICTAMLIWFVFALPSPMFNTPTSFVLEDEKGELLSASIAADGQWRFPNADTLPQKFIDCITTFEDKRFFYHPGVDPFALARSIVQNIRRRKVVSGGSTLTMQVIRLSRGKERTFWQKLIESMLAVRLECSYRKKSILNLYAANAPFGSNVVGLETAAWRYFARSASQLSWGEMAALSVLPNAPSLVHPGRNREILLKKRNELIDKLVAAGKIDATTAQLAKLEPLPGQPLPLPQLAPHLADRFKKEYISLREESSDLPTRVRTTVRKDLQTTLIQLINRHQSVLRGNGINNIAAMVTEVETGNVVAYVGNVYNTTDSSLESHVDVLAAPRSPGSTLKPLLYAAMQTDGQLLPRQLVPDIPTQIGGYTPQNFNLQYDGAVPANTALSRSLNIPAVRMLQQYKYQRFYDVLKWCGFSTLRQPADHYGLSLILGGCEVTPWELAGVYSSLARSYLHQSRNNGKFALSDWHQPNYVLNKKAGAEVAGRKHNNGNAPFDFGAVWHTFNAMQEVMRPGEEGLWNLFNAAQRIAWKTGTSFGFRDGWAVGVTPAYCVVVWVGNTDGEGRPDLTGINTAAPLLFDIYRQLPSCEWFKPPAYDYTYLPVCHESGYKAGFNCVEVDTVLVSSRAVNAPVCPFHHVIHLDATRQFRVTEKCLEPSAMVHSSWFTLPPAMEFYYKAKHSNYLPLPPFRPGCNENGFRQLEVIYPDQDAVIYVPKEMAGNKGKTVFSAAHSNPAATLYWHLDGDYAGTTQQFHKLELSPSPGSHTLTVVDNEGESVTRTFTIQQKE